MRVAVRANHQLAAKATGPTAVRGIFYSIAAMVGKVSVGMQIARSLDLLTRCAPDRRICRDICIYSDHQRCRWSRHLQRRYDSVSMRVRSLNQAPTKLTLARYPSVYIGSALSLVSAAVVYFLVPDINQDFMTAEDERFRQYLEEAGFDTSALGVKPLLDAETLDKAGQQQVLEKTTKGQQDKNSGMQDVDITESK